MNISKSVQNPPLHEAFLVTTLCDNSAYCILTIPQAHKKKIFGCVQDFTHKLCNNPESYLCNHTKT